MKAGFRGREKRNPVSLSETGLCVEMPGIEPGSRRFARGPTTSLVDLCCSHRPRPRPTGFSAGQPIVLDAPYWRRARRTPVLLSPGATSPGERWAGRDPRGGQGSPVSRLGGHGESREIGSLGICLFAPD